MAPGVDSGKVLGFYTPAPQGAREVGRRRLPPGRGWPGAARRWIRLTASTPRPHARPMRSCRTVMTSWLVLAALLGQAAAACAAAAITVYVGTYTDSTSKGIYRFTFDPATGAATPPVLAAEAVNPSFLALHPTGHVLYAVGEIDGAGGTPGGLVSAFAVDRATGGLTLLNQRSSGGGAPCFLTVDRQGRNVLVANYGGGNVAVLPIRADGTLGPASDVEQQQGTGPNVVRQQAAHAHGIHLDPSERIAVSPDLGADRLFVYRYDASAGTLTAAGSGRVEAGAGPRHAVFDATGRVMYAINELTSTISTFDVDAAAGMLRRVQDVPTLPAGYASTNSTAELALSPDGRFLYGSNRGHDSIAVFAVDGATGRLTPAGHVPARGRTPRHFAIDPTGQWMLVAHQGDGTIAVFRIDVTTGMPVPTDVTVRVAKPVCILMTSVPAR